MIKKSHKIENIKSAPQHHRSRQRTKNPIDVKKYISIDPAICHGQPCFRSTRILVYLVLELLETGISVEEILSEDYYPQLNPKHIQAALHYAAELMKTRESIPFSQR